MRKWAFIRQIQTQSVFFDNLFGMFEFGFIENRAITDRMLE